MDTNFANLDYDRAARCGVPEVIFAEFKTPAQCVAIAEKFREKNGFALLTRTTPEIRAALGEHFGAACRERGRAVIIGRTQPAPTSLALDKTAGKILIVAAGTSDLPIAEEAALTVETVGGAVEILADVGVAGLHRLLAAKAKLAAAAVIIVIAGMEGALPSVIAGLVAAPVIAVPTSVGYGASFGGIAALLGMLNSCAGGVAVMNIDNGFGAACHAIKILRTREKIAEQA